MSKKQIRVDRLPGDRRAFVKALRLIGRTGLKQASELAIHLERYRHSVLVTGIDRGTAEHIAALLRDAGAGVTVEASSLDTPMLCTPDVNRKYRWGAFRVISKAV